MMMQQQQQQAGMASTGNGGQNHLFNVLNGNAPAYNFPSQPHPFAGLPGVTMMPSPMSPGGVQANVHFGPFGSFLQEAQGLGGYHPHSIISQQTIR